jgi:hypothetical protein
MSKLLLFHSLTFTWARVSTLGVDASEGVGALVVDGALGPARGRRSDVALEADASSNFVEGAAAGVRTARVVEAGVDGPSLGGGNRN